MRKDITIAKGDTVNLVCTFTDKSGAVIDLTGYTARMIAKNLYWPGHIIFEKEITSFSGASNNQAMFSWTNEETLAWNEAQYQYYVQIEKPLGAKYNSSKGYLFVSAGKSTKADVQLVFGGDNIICTIEDDIENTTFSSSAPSNLSLILSAIPVSAGVYEGFEIAQIVVNGSPDPILTLSGDTTGFTIVGKRLMFTGTLTTGQKEITINAENSQNIGSPYTETFTIPIQ